MTSELYELGYLRAGIEVLSIYLRSDHLFFPLNTPSPVGEPSYRRLTIGGILLTIKRLEARDLPPDLRNGFLSHLMEIDHTRSSKRVGWIQKAECEFQSRLRQWTLYVNELRRDSDHGGFYSSEVSIRVMIELLASEIGSLDPQILEQLAGLDHVLMAVFKKGAFIWDEVFSKSFKLDPYWYLWGRPTTTG